MPANIVVSGVDLEMLESPRKAFCMQFDRIDQGTVDVENSCFFTHGGKFAGTIENGCAVALSEMRSFSAHKL